MYRDDEMVMAFSKGNKRAFNMIFEKLYPAVYDFACRFVATDVAADFTSDAFYKLWEGRENFESLRSIRSYLMVVVRNASLNHLESIKSHRETEKAIAYLSQTEEPAWTEEEEIKAAYFRMVHLALEQLPKQRRKILELAFFEGLKTPAIAERLKISEGTVRNLKTRALKVLRKMMSKEGLFFLICFLATYL